MKFALKYIIVHFLLLASVILLLASFSWIIPEGQKKSTTGGELSFTIRTVTANGNYSPKHVLAIWIEHNDDFVKTRKAMANQRKQYLYTWKAASDYNVVDAITGSTLSSHQTHTVSWDCTDLDGNLVPDGDYEVYAEFTDKHAQGPLYELTFTKGENAMSLTPADETYFKDIALDFTPIIADFSAGSSNICVGGTIEFTDESTNATTWEWDFGEDAIPTSANTQGPHVVYYTTSGTKSVSLTINENITETKPDLVQVATSPAADFSYESEGLTVDFSNLSVNATSYLWDFGDGNTGTDNNPIHTYASAGDYQVTLHASYFNCIDSISHVVNTSSVGIQPLESANNLIIFPNPNSGLFTLSLESSHAIEKINIFAPCGEYVRFESSGEINTGHCVIDITHYKPGIYFLQLSGRNKIITKKIVIL